ncbi:MAG TPA: LysR family transcriptional regulator [Nocardioides sp.]|nr:LysR family transcriptional regulator [Nocardioides sp.]
MLTLTQLRVLDAIARCGSVTAAAKELHFSQPSLSHHMARLEKETGARLLQRAGRGIRLTPAGHALAVRAGEILGRVHAAQAEVTSIVELTAGTVRVAGFASAMSTLMPRAGRELAGHHPGLRLSLLDAHPDEALQHLRTGEVDVAIIFRYDDSRPEDDAVRLVHLLDDPLYLLSLEPGTTVADHRESAWIAGCPRCRTHLLDLCARAGYAPRLTSFTDDNVLMQSMVAAGVGVTTIPGLALQAHHHPAVHATVLPTDPRRIYAATYGGPPDPPAVQAVLAALHRTAAHVRGATSTGAGGSGAVEAPGTE